VIRFLIPVLLILAAASHGRASAQSIAVVPPFVDENVPRLEVESAIARWLASHDRRAVTLQPSLKRELEPCLPVPDSVPPPCAYDYLKRTGADQAIAVWVEGDRAWTAVIIEHGLYYAGHARAATWQEALEQALADGRRRETRGLGPWLEVSGFPGDAKVYVDHEPAGRLRGPPIRLAVGGHQVEVRAPGYETRYDLISVPAATSHATLRVELVTKAAEPVSEHQSDRPTQSLNASQTGDNWRKPVLLSGALLSSATLVIGAVLLARGITLASRRDECVDSCDDRNSSAGYADSAGRSLMWLGGSLGVAGLAGGTGLVVWHIHARVEAGPNLAAFAIGKRF